jgi:hypothetical protein
VVVDHRVSFLKKLKPISERRTCYEPVPQPVSLRYFSHFVSKNLCKFQDEDPHHRKKDEWLDCSHFENSRFQDVVGSPLGLLQTWSESTLSMAAYVVLGLWVLFGRLVLL